MHANVIIKEHPYSVSFMRLRKQVPVSVARAQARWERQQLILKGYALNIPTTRIAQCLKLSTHRTRELHAEIKQRIKQKKDLRAPLIKYFNEMVDISDLSNLMLQHIKNKKHPHLSSTIAEITDLVNITKG